MSTINPKTPKESLEHGIRNEFSSAIGRYYKRFPKTLKNPENEVGIKALLALMLALIRLLDNYEIKHKEPE